MKTIRLSLLALCAGTQAIAEDNQVFLIDSGYYNGLYYQTAAMISALNTQPQGALPCKAGGSCGVEGVLLVNRSSHGSTENLQRLCSGQGDSALAQSNLVYMAYQGEGAFEKAEPCKNLRALASLYTEVLQIAVPKDSGIQSLSDLPGKKVGIGANHSGTHHAVQELFGAAGLSIAEIQFQVQSVGEAAQALKNKEIDAMIFFAGIPAPTFTGLNQELPLRFLSLQSTGIDELVKRSRTYQTVAVKAGTYAGSEAFDSVKVRALWVATDKMDKDWAYQFTKNLWDSIYYPDWLKEMRIANALSVETSLEGISIPLHEGAKRYYNEIGKRF